MASTSPQHLRSHATAIFAAAVSAADPENGVSGAIAKMRTQSGSLLIAGSEIKTPGALRLVAVGKAACTMAAAAKRTLDAEPNSRDLPLTPGIAIVNPENARDVESFDVLTAGHPLPDPAGVAAACQLERYLANLSTEDAVILLLSGGGSALLPAPSSGVTLDDKRRVTEALLVGGADIHALNVVRKHLSRLKGGGLARCVFPAPLEVIIVSDVFDDDLSTIASGPAVADPTTFADAVEILQRFGAWQQAPTAVRTRFEAGLRGEVAETPKEGDRIFTHVRHRIVASNRLSVEAARQAATAAGYETEVMEAPLTGEARRVAKLFVTKLHADAQGHSSRKRAFIAGGETTVTVRGSGRGGRNQELALAVAVGTAGKIAPSAWTFLSSGTDGKDGPTDAAGGIVDGGTTARGEAAGLNAEASLAENDSHTFLDACGDLVRTGATGTNVADIQVLLTET